MNYKELKSYAQNELSKYFGGENPPLYEIQTVLMEEYEQAQKLYKELTEIHQINHNKKLLKLIMQTMDYSINLNNCMSSINQTYNFGDIFGELEPDEYALKCTINMINAIKQILQNKLNLGDMNYAKE